VLRYIAEAKQLDTHVKVLQQLAVVSVCVVACHVAVCLHSECVSKCSCTCTWC
jgi:hypothetical protein